MAIDTQQILFNDPIVTARIALNHKTVADRQECVQVVPEELIRKYILGSKISSNPDTLAVYRAQFLTQFPYLFKPDLERMEGGKYAASKWMFENNEGIFRYFERNVLDVIDYKEGPRRAPAGINRDKNAKPANGAYHEFSDTSLVTDIPIVGIDENDRNQKAGACKNTFEKFLSGSGCRFEVVHEKGKTYIRTDIDERTFSMLGSIISCAAHMELPLEEHIARIRTGQGRVWEAEKNLKNLEIGRVVFPGSFEMTVIGTPGCSFRPDVTLAVTKDIKGDETSKLVRQPDALYDAAAKNARDFRDCDIYWRGKKKVLHMVAEKTPDERLFYQVVPVASAKEAAKQEWKDKFKNTESKIKLGLKVVKLTGIPTELGWSLITGAKKAAEVKKAVSESIDIWETHITSRQTLHQHAIDRENDMLAADNEIRTGVRDSLQKWRIRSQAADTLLSRGNLTR